MWSWSAARAPTSTRRSSASSSRRSARATPGLDGELSEALADPELTSRLGEEEPLLGYDSMAVTDNLTLLYSRRYLHEVAAPRPSARWFRRRDSG